MTEVRRLGTSNQNGEALALVHSAIDPVFSGMLSRTATSSPTTSAPTWQKGSDDLTDQTNATRYSLMLFSALGMLAGMLAAVFVAIVRHHAPAR